MDLRSAEAFMTQAKESVITLERVAKGKTFQEYVDSGIQNLALFVQNYENTKATPEQLAEFKAIQSGPRPVARVVCIGEDWCPDVYRGTGVGARIAEGLGVEFRFFERDQNKDMIAEYLKNGEFESIPVFVFYDKDQREIGHFIERPQLANDEMGEATKARGDTSPEGIAKRLGHAPSEEEIKQARDEARERYMEWQRTSPIWAGWRLATIDECIALLK